MPKTILLADHSTTIHRLVSLALAGEDVKVETVQDGASAIEAIEERTPDLVIADVALQMPTAWDIAAYVRAHVNLESMPVLLLAGAFDVVDGDHALGAGADGVITKPFDPLVLRARVIELLASGRHAAVTVEGPAELKSGWEVQAPADATPSVTDAVSPAVVATAYEAVPVPEPDAEARSEAVASAADHAEPLAEDVAGTEPFPLASPAEDEPAGEDYFDRIDQQFAALSRTPRAPVPEPPAAPSWEDDLPLAPPVEVPAPPPAASTPPAPVALTDAFAALLAAERTGVPAPPMRAVVAAVPLAPIPATPAPAAAPVPAPAPAPIDLDALAEQVARRVLERLSDQAVRETVRDLVVNTTERLVREEIDRIKRNIK